MKKFILLALVVMLLTAGCVSQKAKLKQSADETIETIEAALASTIGKLYNEDFWTKFLAEIFKKPSNSSIRQPAWKNCKRHCSNNTFCLRTERTVNAYRKIPINKLELKVSGVPIREKVQLRIIPHKESGLAEIRFWYNKLVGTQKVKNKNLSLVHF